MWGVYLAPSSTSQVGEPGVLHFGRIERRTGGEKGSEKREGKIRVRRDIPRDSELDTSSAIRVTCSGAGVKEWRFGGADWESCMALVPAQSGFCRIEILSLANSPSA